MRIVNSFGHLGIIGNIPSFAKGVIPKLFAKVVEFALSLPKSIVLMFTWFARFALALRFSDGFRRRFGFPVRPDKHPNRHFGYGQ